ncbi:hypothetical protein D3C71_1740810 [compost metagenome]
MVSAISKNRWSASICAIARSTSRRAASSVSYISANFCSNWSENTAWVASHSRVVMRMSCLRVRRLNSPRAAAFHTPSSPLSGTAVGLRISCIIASGAWGLSPLILASCSASVARRSAVTTAGSVTMPPTVCQ